MINYIILSTYFLGKASANGICARNLYEEIAKTDNVDVICYDCENDEENLNSNIHSITVKKDTFLLNQFKKIFRLVERQFKPNLNGRLVSKYVEEIEKIINKKIIDVIIAMCFPLEALYASWLIKQKHPEVMIVSYELDSVIDGVESGFKHNKRAEIYTKWFKKMYNCVDHIFIMQTHEKYWNNTFKCYIDKLSVVDIPVLVKEKVIHKNNNQRPVLVYSGLIEKRYRPPFYMLALLNFLKNETQYDFYFYSKGDCEEAIKEACMTNNLIHQCGYVAKEEMDSIMKSADFYVSIGNSFSQSVPSKILYYISNRKPIIHFSPNKDDVCLEYLKKYPLSIIVDESNPVESEAKRIAMFMKNNINSICNEHELDVFARNTPCYSADLIRKYAKKIARNV